MSHSELSEENYKRITLINWLLSVPLIVLFGWPYIFLSGYLDVYRFYAYPGAFLFALPFMFTILHGHVTMALGSTHRRHYYDWLFEQSSFYGLLFHPLFTRTRFRMVLLGISAVLLVIGFLTR